MDTSHNFPRPHPQTAGRLIDGEAVLILAEASEIKVLNGVGSRIYELADGTRSIDEIAECLAREYEAPYEQVLRDTHEFLQGLVAGSVMVFERSRAVP